MRRDGTHYDRQLVAPVARVFDQYREESFGISWSMRHSTSPPLRSSPHGFCWRSLPTTPCFQFPWANTLRENPEINIWRFARIRLCPTARFECSPVLATPCRAIRRSSRYIVLPETARADHRRRGAPHYPLAALQDERASWRRLFVCYPF